MPGGVRTNLAYDLWGDTTARRNGPNNAMELMIWLTATGFES